MYDKASEICNDSVNYMALPDNKKRKLGNKHNPVNLFLVDNYNFDDWFKNKKIDWYNKKKL